MSDENAELDQLLDEYKKPEPPQGFDEVVDFVRETKAEKQQSAIVDAISGAVSTIKEDETIGKFSDRVVTGMLHALAAENPDFKSAFDNQAKNPEAWNKQLSWAKEQISADLKIPDTTSEDIAAAQASVRGVSTEAPPESKGPTTEEMNKMGDREFEDLKRDLERQARQRGST